MEGAYETQTRVIAKSVSFKGDDLEKAQAIQAGLHETQAQTQQNKEQLEMHEAVLQQQQQQGESQERPEGQVHCSCLPIMDRGVTTFLCRRRNRPGRCHSKARRATFQTGYIVAKFFGLPAPVQLQPLKTRTQFGMYCGNWEVTSRTKGSIRAVADAGESPANMGVVKRTREPSLRFSRMESKTK